VDRLTDDDDAILTSYERTSSDKLSNLPLPSSVARSDVESQAVECSAKLEAVKKMFESLSRNVDIVYGECDIDSSVEKVEDVMRELPSIERPVRISTEQQMIEGEGLGS
jgi:hypothetical protein